MDAVVNELIINEVQAAKAGRDRGQPFVVHPVLAEGQRTREELPAKHQRGAGDDVAADQDLEAVTRVDLVAFTVADVERGQEGVSRGSAHGIDDAGIGVHREQGGTRGERRGGDGEAILAPDVVLVAEGDDVSCARVDGSGEVGAHPACPIRVRDPENGGARVSIDEGLDGCDRGIS